MYFKFCLFVAYVAACLAIDFNNPAFKAATATCSAENGIDGSFLEKLQKGEAFDLKLLEKKEFKCFVKCVHVKLGLTNDNGEPLPEGVKKYFNIGDKDIEKYSKCFTENTDTDPCDKSFNIQLCVIKQIKSM